MILWKGSIWISGLISSNTDINRYFIRGRQSQNDPKRTGQELIFLALFFFW
mgnify:CR=1 FL=1